MENKNISYMKLPLNIFTLICMYLPIKKILKMQKISKNFYEVIIPEAYLYLSNSFKIYQLDSCIISDYRIK